MQNKQRGDGRELLVADAMSGDIGVLVSNSLTPTILIGPSCDALQVLTAALAGKQLDVLHIVAHGRAGGFSLGGQWIDAASFTASSHLLAQWKVSSIALWSCHAGQDAALVQTLAALTGATVLASRDALGMVDGQPQWRLDSDAMPEAPFDPLVMACWPHRLAALSFFNAYRVNTATTPAAKEANAVDFSVTPLNASRIDDKTGGQNFSGNDVVVELVIEDVAYYGWISRPIKSGGVVRGFYFWTDPQFTSLGAATADSNADGDSNSADNIGFVLVVDQAWFNSVATTSGSGGTLKNVGTSSDRVDSGLNGLLPVNSAPAPVNDSAAFAEDADAQAGNVLSNDTDANNDALSVTGFSIGGVAGTLGMARTITNVGTFTLNADGSYSFTPVANYAGTVPLISYTVADGRGGSGTASLSINVAQVNDAPSGADKLIIARENTAYTFSAADFGFSDTTDNPANALLSVKITTLPAAGALTLNGVAVAAGAVVAAADITKLKFVPAADSGGTGYASFTFQVRDNGGGATDTDLSPNTITFDVSDVNSAPTAVADTQTATEAGGINNASAGTNPSGNLLVNDTDPDSGDAKSVVSASGSASATTAVTNNTALTGNYGSLSLSSDGSYTYTVNNGNTAVQALRTSASTLTDTFTYTMKDAAGLTSSATLTVTINGANDAAGAVDDFSFAIASNVASARLNPVGNVLTNDHDVDAGDAMTISRASSGSSLSGTIVSVDGGTSVSGSEGRLYGQFSTQGAGNLGSVGTAVSGTGVPAGTTVASVNNVSGLKTVTFANAYGGLAALDGVTSITVNGNSFVIDSLGAASTSVIAISSLSGGTISSGMAVTGSGIQDGTTVSSVAVSGSYSFVTLSTTVSGTLGTDVQFGSSGTSITGEHGTLVLQQDGSYTYTVTDATPTAATDTFTYEVTDSAGALSTAQLSVQVIVSNVAPPAAAADSKPIEENAVSVSDDVLTNDTQSSGTKAVSDAWSATASAMTTVTAGGVTLTGLYGSLLIKTDGSYTYTLDNANASVDAMASGQSLTDSFSYRMGSSSDGYAVAALNISINGANDAPLAAADSATAREAGGSANATIGFNPAGNVLTNDTDVDSGDAKSVTHGGTSSATTAVGGSLVIAGTYGSLTLGADGSYSYVVNNAHADVQALSASSAALADSFSYQMRDTTGATSSAALTVSVLGANDAPTIAKPSSPTIAEGVSGALAGISVADVDDASLTVTLTVLDGTVTIGALNGATVSAGANGSATLTLSGTKGDLNLALATLSYQGASDFSGIDTLSISTSDADSLTSIDTLDITVTPDNRALTVSAPTVNEASPYAVFDVAGVAGQKVTLAVGADTAANGADYVGSLEYYDGSAWQGYDGNAVAIPAGDKLLVRVAILNDSLDEGAETFSLTATNKAGAADTKAATIIDDGTALVYDGTVSAGAAVGSALGLDDDRALAVTSVTVNEASPYAVFKVTGAASQVVSLALENGSASNADHGAGIEYFDGTAWQGYTTALALPAGGILFLRTSITSDTVYEGPETFAMVATNLSGRSFVGTATITDDGTGSVYPGTISAGSADSDTSELDNDLAVSITAYGPVNEGSDYAMFTVTATAGEVLDLSVAGNGASPATASGFGIQFSTDGTSWTTYDASTQPVVPAGGVVYVRVGIASEQDAFVEGAETFTLTAATSSGAGRSASEGNTIVDDGTGSKYDGTLTTGVPTATTTGLDHDTAVDTTPPTIAISSNAATLGAGQAATITFTLSEASSNFAADDVTVSGGTLSGFNGSGASYSATFTPAASSTENGVVSVASSTFTDGAGNANADGVDTNNIVSMNVNTVVADTTPPTVAIASDKSTLAVGQTATITFTLSEASTSFGAGDITVSGGVLSGFTGSGTSYSAIFTPAPNSTASGVVSVDSGNFTDAAGNANADGADADNTVSMGVNTVDTVITPPRAALPAPTVTITEDADNDGHLGTAELQGDVDVSIALPAGVVAGDVLSIRSGTTSRSVALTAQMVTSGVVTTTFAAPAKGESISVSASVTDTTGQAGAIGSDSALRGNGTVLAFTAVTPDTGIVGDFITTEKALVLSGTAETGTVVRILLGGALVGTTVAVNDKWTFDNTGSPLQSGDNVFTVVAGGETATVVVRIFTAELDPASDDGDSNTDHQTSITTPDFILKAENIMVAGDTARLLDPQGVVVGRMPVTEANVAAGQVNVPTDQLDDGVYIFMAQILDANGQVKVSQPVTVTIVTDRDGVMPSVELRANGGDFNKDGIADWQQNNVAQLPLASVDAYLAGKNAPASAFGAIMAGNVDPSLPGAAVQLEASAQLMEVGLSPQPAPLPANMTAATPMFNFSITGVGDQALQDIDPARAGLQTRVVIDLPAGVTSDVFLKWNTQTQSWYSFNDDQRLDTFDDGATLLDTDNDGKVDRVVLTLTDGAPGDEDGAANGIIVDPGMLAFQSSPVYSVLLASGDRYYTIDAAEAAKVATGTGNVFEGARFDSLSGGQQMYASFQPFTRDWYFGADQQEAPYLCYERVDGTAGFMAAAAGQGIGASFHLYLKSDGLTQLVTQGEASALGLATKGYVDKGAQFSTTTGSAFVFDAEGYLVANKDNAEIQAFVLTLSAKFQHSSDAGFIEAVEQQYLGQVTLVGLAHGGAATAADLNLAFGTHF